MVDGMHGNARRWRGWACGLALLWGLAACSPKPPIRVGFLGGLSDRAAAFSEDARNGVILGIEQRNRAGGVAGRPIELIVQDYGVGEDQVIGAFKALVDARVDAVIGPYASGLAIKLLPLVDEARLLMLSPTVTALALAGRDDHMIRLNRTTRDSARSYARLLHERGHRRVALARDMRNTVFSVSWSDDFREAFAGLGGAVVAEVGFGAEPATPLETVMNALLAKGPDSLVFVASAADAAALAQQAVRHTPVLPMAAVDWAANAALIELGGRAVEGMLVAQAYKIGDDSLRYRAFHDAYLARFGRTPSASAIASYDAVTVLADAMARAKVRGRGDLSLRDAVLQFGPYEGLQQTIRIDRFGDATRTAYFTVVRNGRFEMLP